MEKNHGANIVFLGTDGSKGASFVALSNKTEVDAKKIIESAILLCGGNGGGNKNYAQSMGGDCNKIDTVISGMQDVGLKIKNLSFSR